MNAPSAFTRADIRTHYQAQGFVHLHGFFAEPEVESLRKSLAAFHENWLRQNEALYCKGAINSAYLTDDAAAGKATRRQLFQILGDSRIAQLLEALVSEPQAFLNTQLFFDPKNPAQPNYWHRDIQYAGLSLEEQQAQFCRMNMFHLRLALRDEPGLELMPGTHRRWDTDEEFAVRMKQAGRRVDEPLPGAQVVPLSAGDLLVFSANMLHRGLYGMGRFAFDMLFCDARPDLLRYARRSCLPSEEELAGVDCPQLFTRTRQVLDQAGL
ncbi:MAG: phytanoyl-CoA dioxygenase family protein [Pseudomonadales bacterium]|nr:phytanoyl-CoA dioxygenase family protein [Pseudomonadales bacterium]MCP5329613.1 phytanoyl-CoA dioxygenase family protein [Pseudomonadales bacterium]MCP5343848.1 phytanoyl-CoA dioxygenase family protein [Pseudomonadales bacterium]